MAQIIMGDAPIVRAIHPGGGQTIVLKSNPASEAGTITLIKVWCNENLSNFEVGIFFVVSGDNLSTRANAAIGSVTAGSVQEFVVSLAVEIGDYLGFYLPASSGKTELDTSGGAGDWYTAGDHIPCTNHAFTAEANNAWSVQGLSASGWSGGDIGEVPIADIAKIEAVALADITKVDGVA